MKQPARGVVTQKFHAGHEAIDIANITGTLIIAPEAGTITIAGMLGDCGLAVQIGNETNGHRLCHNQKLFVKVGQKVVEGQKVAEMGFTGLTNPDDVPAGSHCHWVCWKNGERVDGLKELKGESMYKGRSAKYWYEQFVKKSQERNTFLGLVLKAKKLFGGK